MLVRKGFVPWRVHHCLVYESFLTQKSAKIKIFHQPRLLWNKGISLTKLPFGVTSAEVAIVGLERSTLFLPPKSSQLRTRTVMFVERKAFASKKRSQGTCGETPNKWLGGCFRFVARELASTSRKKWEVSGLFLKVLFLLLGQPTPPPIVPLQPPKRK